MNRPKARVHTETNLYDHDFSGIRFTKPMEKRYTHQLLFGMQYLVDIYSTACGEYVKCHLYYPETKELKEENSITEKLLNDCDEAVRGTT